jgi:hypothetical protein
MVRGKKNHEKGDKDQLLKGYICYIIFLYALGASLAQKTMYSP